MALGYYLVEIGSDGQPVFDDDGLPIPTGDLITLPVGRWGRSVVMKRTNVILRTEKGRNWVLEKYSGMQFTLPFRVVQADLEILRALDNAVGGIRDPFLIVAEVGASPLLTYFVRKDEDFDEGSEQPVMRNGVKTRLVDITIMLKEEPQGLEIAV